MAIQRTNDNLFTAMHDILNAYKAGSHEIGPAFKSYVSPIPVPIRGYASVGSPGEGRIPPPPMEGVEPVESLLDPSSLAPDLILPAVAISRGLLGGIARERAMRYVFDIIKERGLSSNLKTFLTILERYSPLLREEVEYNLLRKFRGEIGKETTKFAGEKLGETGGEALLEGSSSEGPAIRGGTKLAGMTARRLGNEQ